MIQCDSITKKYDEFSGVRDFSYTFSKSENVTLFGPSGCGKTTLLRIIAGLETPDAGMLLLQGKTANHNGTLVIPPQKRNISMLFQNLALWPHMNALENVKFCINPNLYSKTERIKIAKEILKEVGLLRKISHLPSSLSGGEKKRVALARCLVTDFNILLLDEPFTHLDEELKDLMLNLVLKKVKENNALLILATHDRGIAELISDKIIYLNEGVIRQIENLREINTYD